MIDGNLTEDQRRRARILIATYLADFIIHLVSVEAPMVIGANYPRDRIVREFEAWAKARNLDISETDLREWQTLYQSGLLQ